jgi:hypothetical protein
MKTKELETAVGGLSQTSKMPCPSWSISAKRCNVGGKLAQVKGSICEGCYALKGAYAWGNTQEALERRWEAYSANPAAWAFSMTLLIAKKKLSHFRWFDSGDLQSVEMLECIVDVAKLVPGCRFWLPTKEFSIVSEYVKKHGAFPENLNVRLSAYVRDKQAPVSPQLKHFPTSTVTDKAEPIGFACPSKDQGNKCQDCRACWDQSVSVVSYYWH